MSARAEQIYSRKLVLLGFRGVGKSSLAGQFVQGKFGSEDEYTPTIEQTYQKVVTLQSVKFRCDVVDTAGMDEYSTFSNHASVGAHGYIFVFSITSRSSLEKIKKLHENLLNLTGRSVPIVLVGQKCDLNDMREVTSGEAEEIAARWRCPYLEVSAKLNRNVVETFHELLRQIEKDSKLLDPPKTKSACAIL